MIILPFPSTDSPVVSSADRLTIGLINSSVDALGKCTGMLGTSHSNIVVLTIHRA